MKEDGSGKIWVKGKMIKADYMKLSKNTHTDTHY